MRYECPYNTNNTIITYVRNRIEPNYFIVYYKNVARIKTDPIEVGRVFGVAKFTQGVKDIREWCKEMVAKYESADISTDTLNSGPGVEPTGPIDKAGGFGPECHEEPNDNTKMIV